MGGPIRNCTVNNWRVDYYLNTTNECFTDREETSSVTFDVLVSSVEADERRVGQTGTGRVPYRG